MNKSLFTSTLQTATPETSSAKRFALPDKCYENGVACTWRSGDHLTIYPYSKKNTRNITSIDNKISKIRPEVILFTPIIRRLVNESNGTFLALQKIAAESQNTDNHVEFLKISRQYRSVIRVCIESLQEAADAEQDAIKKNSLISYITIFYSIECIWHLSEILFVDNIPGDVILPNLLEWVQFHYPCHEQVAAELLEACERGSEDHPKYWDAVIGILVQGRVDVARGLLKLHSMAETNEFKLVDNSLKNMPVYSVYGGMSSGEFTLTWKHWQAECRSKVSGRAFSAQPHLELLMRLIIGDYAAFEAIQEKFSSWFDLLGGWVMFTNPCAKKHELSTACASMPGAGRLRSPLDIMVRALADGDLHQVVHGIQQMADNGWFATHLIDLLHHCGKLKMLDNNNVQSTTRLRDSLILEYGSILTEHQSLWSVGVSYLCAVPPEGTRRAELMLERIPLRTEAKAMAVIGEAEKHELLGVVKTVSSCMSARYLSAAGSAGRELGAALAWAVRARSPPLCARAADAALRHYARDASLPHAALLLTIGPNMLLCDRLLFLCKYCEFHRLYKSRDFKAAGKLLVSLLTSNIAPDYFWDILLIDTLPLLESDTLYINRDDTSDIMAVMELKPNTLDEEKATLLRLALVRNLAKAVLTVDE